MKSLRDIHYVDGIKVLLRTDFNVPIKNGVVVDDFRIRAALPTINFLLGKGATVVMVSHLESNDGTNSSLEPVATQLKKLGVDVTFIKDMKHAYTTIDAGQSKVFLLENIRFFEGEKKNDPAFARELASLADVYVNDAFSVSHRAHASIVGVPSLMPKYAGLQLENEVAHLSKAFSPAHPFLFILGGAKFATKMPLIDKFATIADSIFIGGALANDLLKARGQEVGKSLVSDSPVDLSRILANPKIFSYVDVAVAGDGVKSATDLKASDLIADAGQKTIDVLKDKIAAAKFILWNGPFGIYEKGFTWGTEECARLIAENESAMKIVGGGDTLAAIAKLGIENKFSFVSTGGGAMLEYLAKGTLVGIEALG